MASLNALPVPAKLWWLAAVVTGALCAPAVVGVTQPGLGVPALLALAAASAAAHVLTNYQVERSEEIRFDYSSLCIVSALFLAGPVAALAGACGRHLAVWVLRRPAWFKPLYNLAVTLPVVLAAWTVSSVIGRQPLGMLAGAFVGSVLLCTCAAVIASLSSRRSVVMGLRSVWRQSGWGELNEVVLPVCLVVLWQQQPLAALAVPLAAYASVRNTQMAIAAGVRALQAEDAARRDRLTGIANRGALDSALTRPASSEGAVLMIDLDHFKRVNDTYGHATGDSVLRAAARAIQATIRPADFVARYGGEEFCAVLWSTSSPDQAAAVAERVRLAIQALRFPDTPELVVTASIGAACWAPTLVPLAALRAADAAAYRAKRSGRNNVQIGCAEEPDADSVREAQVSTVDTQPGPAVLSA